MTTLPDVTFDPFARRPGAAVRGLANDLLARQRTLTLFAALLLLTMIPVAAAWGIDERLLRGANVWIKPLKFLLSVAVLALTTAWFIGHLPAAQRGSRAVKAIVAVVVLSGGFEIVYIVIQAALGQGSHFNVGDPFHATMYALMGVGALLLTATQPALAWQLYRHPDTALPPAYRLAVLLGLVLTFVLGAGVGLLLGGRQPPTGAGLPLLGWSTVAGDLRPAHFVGIHAEQVLPVVGAVLAATAARHARLAVGVFALLYASVCIGLASRALAGLPFIG